MSKQSERTHLPAYRPGKRYGAYRRHAIHYLSVLIRANDLLLQAGDGYREALALFDFESRNIETAQRCPTLPALNVGPRFIKQRTSPRPIAPPC